MGRDRTWPDKEADFVWTQRWRRYCGEALSARRCPSCGAQRPAWGRGAQWVSPGARPHGGCRRGEVGAHTPSVSVGISD